VDFGFAEPGLGAHRPDERDDSGRLVADPDETARTFKALWQGTRLFMPPEHFNGRPVELFKSDVFAFGEQYPPTHTSCSLTHILWVRAAGVTLWNLLTGTDFWGVVTGGKEPKTVNEIQLSAKTYLQTCAREMNCLSKIAAKNLQHMSPQMERRAHWNPRPFSRQTHTPPADHSPESCTQSPERARAVAANAARQSARSPVDESQCRRCGERDRNDGRSPPDSAAA
jgi:serine/threonine protein kinase